MKIPPYNVVVEQIDSSVIFIFKDDFINQLIKQNADVHLNNDLDLEIKIGDKKETIKFPEKEKNIIKKISNVVFMDQKTNKMIFLKFKNKIIKNNFNKF